MIRSGGFVAGNGGQDRISTGKPSGGMSNRSGIPRSPQRLSLVRKDCAHEQVNQYDGAWKIQVKKFLR